MEKEGRDGEREGEGMREGRKGVYLMGGHIKIKI